VLAALAGIDGEAVERTVIARLSDPHWSVRKAAIEVLRQKPAAGIEAILARLAEGDPDAAVRQAAKEALGR
jgi:HEAT repeat protein